MIKNISQLVAQTESANNLYALRFERKFAPSQANVLKCAGFNKVSIPTAEMICATSWGLYQIMGENIYHLGFKAPILEFWKNQELQLEYFNGFLVTRYINFTLDEVLNDKVKRDKFATRYNGSVLYGDRLLNIYNQLKDK